MLDLTINPLHPIFGAELLGAELLGADLTDPPTRELVEAVERAMASHALLVVRDCNLSDEQHIAFSRAFGPLELPPGMDRFAGNKAGRIAPELFDISNLDENGEIIERSSERRKYAQATERFHTDSSFHTLPTKWSLLLGHIIPPTGGDTHFVDTRAVYDALPAKTKEKAETLLVVHDFWRGRELAGAGGVTEEMRQAMPAVTQPLICTMTYGRKALYIGAHATGIVGWPEDDALSFLHELYDFATQDKFVYVHKWRQGDLLIWDNRCTLHRATPMETDDYKRDVRRTTINEYGPEAPAGAAAS